MERGGETIGRAVSVWALIDTESRELIRVNDFDLKLPTDEPNSLSLERFRLPANTIEVGKYKVCYGDLDQNRHMNNTRYPDMYSNFLPLCGKRIKSISINYFNEAPMGDTLTIQMASPDSGLYYFRSVRSDGKVNTEAQIELVDI